MRGMKCVQSSNRSLSVGGGVNRSCLVFGFRHSCVCCSFLAARLRIVALFQGRNNGLAVRVNSPNTGICGALHSCDDVAHVVCSVIRYVDVVKYLCRFCGNITRFYFLLHILSYGTCDDAMLVHALTS